MTKQSPSWRTVVRRLAVGLGGFLLLAAMVAPPYGVHRKRDTYQCSTCLSMRDVFQWRIGNWASRSAPLSLQREQVVDSMTFKQFTPRPHVHDWRFAQGSPYYWFGTQWGGCALGAGRHRNELGELAERWTDEFNDFVSRKLTTGSITTNQLYEALTSPRRWRDDTKTPTFAQARAKQLVEEFFKEP